MAIFWLLVLYYLSLAIKLDQSNGLNYYLNLLFIAVNTVMKPPKAEFHPLGRVKEMDFVRFYLEEYYRLTEDRRPVTDDDCTVFLNKCHILKLVRSI